MPSAANTASAASRRRPCCAGRRLGGDATLPAHVVPAGWSSGEFGSHRIFLPLTNGAGVPYSLNGTSPPIVWQTGDQSESFVILPLPGAHSPRCQETPDDDHPRSRSARDGAAGARPEAVPGLAVIAVAQLMVVPRQRRGDHRPAFGPALAPHLHGQPQWMLTRTPWPSPASCLGGRIADYLGRKRMFVISLIGFAAASALGGLP